MFEKLKNLIKKPDKVNDEKSTEDKSKGKKKESSKTVLGDRIKVKKPSFLEKMSIVPTATLVVESNKLAVYNDGLFETTWTGSIDGEKFKKAFNTLIKESKVSKKSKFRFVIRSEETLLHKVTVPLLRSRNYYSTAQAEFASKIDSDDVPNYEVNYILLSEDTEKKEAELMLISLPKVIPEVISSMAMSMNLNLDMIISNMELIYKTLYKERGSGSGLFVDIYANRIIAMLYDNVGLNSFFVFDHGMTSFEFGGELDHDSLNILLTHIHEIYDYFLSNDGDKFTFIVLSSISHTQEINQFIKDSKAFKGTVLMPNTPNDNSVLKEFEVIY